MADELKNISNAAIAVAACRMLDNSIMKGMTEPISEQDVEEATKKLIENMDEDQRSNIRAQAPFALVHLHRIAREFMGECISDQLPELLSSLLNGDLSVVKIVEVEIPPSDKSKEN